MNSRVAPIREFLYLRSDCKCSFGKQGMTDQRSQWKANVALGIQLVVQLRLFSTTLTPRLLCFSPSLQELISPFLSLDAELSSHFHLSVSAGWMDAWESWQRRTNLTRQTSHLRPPHLPTLSPLHLLLPLLHFPCCPFISPDLTSTPFLSCSLSSPHAPAFSRCITYGFAAGRAAVLETAWGLRSHLVLSIAKPNTQKAS